MARHKRRSGAPRPTTTALPSKRPLQIERLSDEGRGMAFSEGKTWFVDQALAGETVEAVAISVKRGVVNAESRQVLAPSPERREPFCPHYRRCGGCQLQHLSIEQQRTHKWGMLLRRVRTMAKVEPEQRLPDLCAEDTGYRERCRLAFERQGGRWVVGFKAAQSHRVVPLEQCAVLSPALWQACEQVMAHLPLWPARQQLSHAEVAIGESGDWGVCFYARHPADQALQQALSEMAQSLSCVVRYQSPEQDWCTPDEPRLLWSQPHLPKPLAFLPGDFTQVNRRLNGRLTEQVLQALDLQAGERALDLFCGMGNFTLPLACTRPEATIVGIDAGQGLLERAQASARSMGCHNVRFECADLFAEQRKAWKNIDKVLLDPPRAGAVALMPALIKSRPERIVYVSCDSATLARDIGLLTAAGYALQQLGLVDFFPHTQHAEAMAVLARP